MKIKKFLFYSFLNLFLFIPVFIVFFLFFQNKILDVDALAYHLFAVRLIEDNIFFFFNRPNVEIGSGLGYELSIFYPNFYSYVVFIIKKISTLDTYKSSYILGCLIYIVCLCIYKNFSSKLLFLIYFLLPANFLSLFVSGNNYFLTSFLIFLLFLTFYNKKNIFLIIILSLMLINTHVLMSYVISIYFLIEIIFRKKENKTDIYLIFGYFFIIIIYFLFNKFITGSFTFPFLQNVFPNNYYDHESWMLITEHLKRSIYNSDLYASKFFLIIYLLLPGLILYLVLSNKKITLKNKIIFFFIILPSFFFFILGFRHRIIFLTASFLIFLNLIDLERLLINFLRFFKKIMFNKYLQVLFIIPLISVLIFKIKIHHDFVYVSSEQNPKINQLVFYDKVSNYQKKVEFYEKLNDISTTNKVFYTEIPVENIENYKNLISPLKYTNEINSHSSAEEFVNFLRNENIKYITHTPLSSKNPYNLKFPHVKFLNQMIKRENLDIIFSNNKEILNDKYRNENLQVNWIIYEIK